MLELAHSSPPTWLHWTSLVLIWSAIVLTIVSGLEYILLATKKTR
jgi:phosphatidylglycerophosphate synthase